MEDNILEHVDGISTVDVNPDDILIVTVDCGKMRPGQAERYMGKVKDKFAQTFSDIEIMVISNNIDLSVLHMVEDPIIL
jgi:hypothetical protein